MAELATSAWERGRASDARIVALVSGAHFVSHVYYLVLPPLFFLIKAEYGVSYWELSLPIAAFNAVSAVLQTPAGFVVDRFGARPMLIAGLALGSVAIGIAGIVPSYWALVAMFALAGLANTVFHPADYSILSQACSPKRIGQAFSVHTFSGLMGSAVAPAAMLILAGIWGWRGALVGASAFGLVMAAILLLNREAFAAAERGPAKPRAAARGEGGEAGWKLLLSAPILANLAFFVLLAVAGGGMQNYSVVALGALFGTPADVASYALSGYLLMGALGVLLGGVIADRTRHHYRVAAIGFACSAVTVLTIGTAGLGGVVLIAVMAVGGLLNGVIMPSRDMIVRSVTPPGSFGKVFGFVSTGFNIGGALSPQLYGWLMDQGSPRLIFLTVFACILVSLLTVIVRAPARAQVPA